MAAINIPVKDYYVYGTALASKACSGWFSSQIAASAQSNLLTSELGLIGTAAGAAGGPVGAGAAAAAGFGASTLGAMQANSPGGLASHCHAWIDVQARGKLLPICHGA